MFGWHQVKLTYGWADSDFAWAVNAANVSFMLALVPMNKLCLGPGTGAVDHLVDFRENLQETIDFPMK